MDRDSAAGFEYEIRVRLGGLSYVAKLITQNGHDILMADATDEYQEHIYNVSRSNSIPSYRVSLAIGKNPRGSRGGHGGSAVEAVFVPREEQCRADWVDLYFDAVKETIDGLKPGQTAKIDLTVLEDLCRQSARRHNPLVTDSVIQVA